MLFFRSGGELFAIDVASVEEVVIGGEWTPVPLAPPSVVGIVNHRGKIFTIVDFACLAGLESTSGAEGQAVFLHRQEMSVGVAVEGVEGIEWVPLRLLDRPGAPAGGGQPEFIRGLLDFEGKMAAVVDPEKLADAIARLPGSPEV